MIIFEDLLIYTAPIQAFLCNLFSILLLLQYSHQNLVWMSITPVLKYWNIFCSASIFHFLPQIIFVHLSCLKQTSLQPCTCTHLLALSSGCPCFFHPILKFWFYLLWSWRQTSCGISSYFFICYQCFTSSLFPPVAFMQNSKKTSAATEERSE